MPSFLRLSFPAVGDRYGTWFWVDGDDIKKEGIWIWDENHSLVNYTNWGPGEPSGIWGPNREDCMVLWGPFNFAWGDYLCYLKSHFICEKR